jgi:hypothetical protein
MYVILTSKPGQFRTEIDGGLQPVETYDYLFCGRKRAQFVIAQLSGEVKVRIVDESTPPIVNLVPAKFLPSFDTIEKARHELQQLVRFGSMDIKLVKL